MRQLIRTYEITGDHEITITGYTFTKEDVRLIIDETVAITNKKASILVSSTAKNNIVSIVNGVITLSDSTANLTVGDELTIEIDIDNVAKSSEIPTVAQIQDGLAKELDASNNKAETIESINLVVNGQASAIINTVNSQAGSVINTVNSQASATNGIINQQTNTISSIINTQASGLTQHINGKTDSIINTVNAQAQAIAAQLDNSIAKEESVQSLINLYQGAQVSIPESIVNLEIQPNVLYLIFDRSSDLNITLAQEIPNQINEYHLIITTLNSVPTITFPNSIDWNDSQLQLGIYDKVEISILNNSAIWM